MANTPVRAFVLSGGGARGAYEAGVLAYIFQELPPKLLESGRVRICCGTSVGAVHACFLAATAHMPQYNIGNVLNVWRSLRLEQLLRLGTWDLLRLPLDLRAMFNNSQVEGMLLNSQVLQRIVMRDIPWPHIRKNLQAGYMDALTVSATHIASGKTVVFIDRPNGGVPPWTRDARRIARGVRIGPLHALASAAIPILFPATSIDGAFYCDGGLRQNTPLSPALRLGADRVLVVAVGHGRDSDVPTHYDEAHESYPGPSLLLGKVLNALMLDHLDYDLAQLRGFNRLLEDGVRAFGPSFLTQLSASTEQFRGQGYRKVDTLVIRPSRDLGEMAKDCVASGHTRLRGLASWVLRKIAAEDSANNSDLLSYLCFDGSLASSLIELGRSDADAARSQLLAFFGD